MVDPIVLYDKLAQRWIFSQFSVTTTPYLQCVAVSTTSDATGTFNRYSFQYNNFDDYPKMGVWPDGYYITFKHVQTETPLWAPDACSYNRTAMVKRAKRQPRSASNRILQSAALLPSDLDGTTSSASGIPKLHALFRDQQT